MNYDYPKEICDICGEETYRRNLSLHKIMELSKRIKPGCTLEDYSKNLADIAGVPQNIAKEWAKHGLFESCPKKQANCPQCGNLLKTWKAKLCLACGGGKSW